MTDKNDSDAVAERIADSVREQINDGQSRRGFLSRSALAGSALLAIGGGAGVALADEHEGEGAEMASFDDVEGTDVDVLNYALSLEQFESAFYDMALDTFSEEDFVDADALSDYSEEQREMVYGDIEIIAEHEAQHVEVLTQAVELLGGDPMAPGEYEFDFEEVGGFFSLAQSIENLGVSAYAGAAPFIESPDLLSAALSIHSVEARHAALLNVLAGQSAFPSAFDAASSQSEVLDTVSQFMAGDGEAPDDDETEMPDDDETEAPDDDETETPSDDDETETPADGEATPADGEATPDGNDTMPGGNDTMPNGTAGNETTTPNGN